MYEVTKVIASFQLSKTLATLNDKITNVCVTCYMLLIALQYIEGSDYIYNIALSEVMIVLYTKSRMKIDQRSCRQHLIL